MPPLSGVTVLEFAGLGPTPYGAMLLADLGADVIRVDRIGSSPTTRNPVLDRNRRSIALDLKHPDALGVVLRMVEHADILIEGFRPGVAERLGFGPEPCLARNPRLVYGRMTGWGQDGSAAHTAGHDITYLALTGALHAIGRAGERPVPPLNLVGDFGGGGMPLALGLVCALLEARASGLGQVVDTSIVDGASSLMAMIYGMHAIGEWVDERGVNLLDGGCPYYDTYRCADGRYVAVGAIEDRFYAELLDGLGLSDDPICVGQRTDPDRWPAIRDTFTNVFAGRTRDEWTLVFAGRDACVAPVLTLTEAPRHPRNTEREVFQAVDGVPQPRPVPRFSRCQTVPPAPSRVPGAYSEAVLAGLGMPADEIERLSRQRVIYQAESRP